MYDFGHLLYDPKPRIKVDSFTNGSYNGEWQTWIKPAQAKFIYIHTVGGGGGGGCSTNTVAAQKNGAGGGGGSGTTSSAMYPAMFVPPVLYIQVGAGGVTPLVSGGVGASGGNSVVGVDTSGQPWGLFTQAGGGGGGGAGGTAAGAAGAAGTATEKIQPPYASQLCKSVYNADSSLHNSGGAPGSAGGAPGGTGGAINLSLPAFTGSGPCSGGTGGGSSGNATVTGLAGGLIDFTVITQYSGFSNNAAGAAGSRGNDGWALTFGSGQQLWWLGGTGGGGGNTSVTAGGGGNGSKGCGGGGAGGTWALNTLAQPGNGGDGYVFITSFF